MPAYLPWALAAMLTYGTVAVLIKLAFRGIPAPTVLWMANVFVVVGGLGWSLLRGHGLAVGLGWNAATGWLALAGVVLAASILSYYRALSLGHASVVVPIFALSFTVATVLGFIVLGEPVKATRVAGVVLAAAAIVLLTR
jgi:transporter family protein